MDNAWAALVILLLAAPEVLEGAKGSYKKVRSGVLEKIGQHTQDRATNPDGVLPLRRCNDLDFHGGWAQGSQLLLHPVRDTGVHGGTTRKNDVAVEVTTDIKIALEDGVVAENTLSDHVRFVIG
jgi:hypothetical protein